MLLLTDKIPAADLKEVRFRMVDVEGRDPLDLSTITSRFPIIW